mmetsp:Transcript_167639/g.538413  ORF Transcript_167639/g.538413 Transcript_167639/m.538413 type:complete len:440 (-) Transcript_167639:227-1546(-)
MYQGPNSYGYGAAPLPQSGVPYMQGNVGPSAGTLVAAEEGSASDADPRRPARKGLCGVVKASASCAPCPDDQPETSAMTYAGSGQGEYIQEMTYKYVGNGEGDFNVTVSGNKGAWKQKLCFEVGGAMLLVAVLVGAALFVVLGGPPTVSTSIVKFADLSLTTAIPEATSTVSSTTQQQETNSSVDLSESDPYDCDLDLPSFETTWCIAKQVWCCSKRAKGCIGESGTAGSTKAPYDCDAGLVNWQAGWSEAKQRYCCREHGTGCAATSTSTATTTTSLPFECTAGLASWELGWSADKKAFCCERVDCTAAATTTTTTTAAPSPALPYDCFAGDPASWLAFQKAWCCQHGGGRGCPPDPEAATYYDCSLGAASSWSSEKQAWCCHSAPPKGCSSTTALPEPYQCGDELDHWETVWSTGKKAWCCHMHSQGCTTPAPDSVW